MSKSLRSISKLVSSTFGSSIAAFLFMTCVCLSGTTYAAVLNVDLDVRTNAKEKASIINNKKRVAIFVLDRSTSMLEKPEEATRLSNGEIAEDRNQVLKDLFTSRIKNLHATAPETIVYIYSFSDPTSKKNSLPYTRSAPFSLQKQSDFKAIIDSKELSRDACGGETYLYDTLDSVMEFIDELLKDKDIHRLSLFIYTDGKNQTRHDANYPSVLEIVNGRQNTAKYNEQLKQAKANFERLHGFKFGKYAKEGKMETHWRWLGKEKDKPNDVLVKTKDEYEVSLEADKTLLKNPKQVPDQKISVTMNIALPEEYLSYLSGTQALLTLQLEGKTVDSKYISLKPGSNTKSFSIGDNISAGNIRGKLIVTDLPEWDRVSLRAGMPLDLSFSEPGRLSFSEIEPNGEIYVKTGTNLVFSAKTDGAKISWNWSEGKREGNSCSIPFNKPGRFEISLKAEKEDFLPVEEKIFVNVIDASVNLGEIKDEITVGKSVGFEAKVTGRPKYFAWWVDKQFMSEQGAKLKHEFKSVGSHKVKIRAYYEQGIVADSGEVTIEVGAAPFIDITEPKSGSEFAFGDKIECKASIVGDFKKVIWKLVGPVEEELEASVSNGESLVFFKPTKGGKYNLTATAIDAVGNKLQSRSTVTLYVANENLGIKFVDPSPAFGAEMRVGFSEKDIELRVKVDGEHITNIKWFVSTGNGADEEIRTTPVQNGEASCSFKPSLATKDGTHLFIHAEAIMDGDALAEPVISPLLELVASRYAAIVVKGTKNNGGEANESKAKFGDAIDLLAEPDGDAKNATITWYQVVGETEQEIGTGFGISASYNASNSDGIDTVPVYYYAVAKLSDGSLVSSKNRIKVCYEHQPVSARFKICKSTSNDTPAGTWIPRKWTVAIVSNCEGDVAGLHWYLDDDHLTNYDNRATFEYDCDTVGKHEFKLVAFDLAGKESEDTHSVHVYRLVLVIVLVILALVGIIYFWYLWSFDDPRFWKLFVIASEDNSLDERSALDAMPTSGKSIMRYWETWNNRALIPLFKLGGRISSEEWKKGTPNGDAKLCLQESQHARSEGDKRDRDPQATLQESAPDMLMQVYNNGRLLKITAIPRSSQKSLTALWIKIDTSKKGANNAYLWYRLVTTILIIGIVAVLIAVFAA